MSLNLIDKPVHVINLNLKLRQVDKLINFSRNHPVFIQKGQGGNPWLGPNTRNGLVKENTRGEFMVQSF